MKKIVLMCCLVGLISGVFGQDTAQTDQDSFSHPPKKYTNSEIRKLHKKKVKLDFIAGKSKAAYFGIYPSIAFGVNRFMDNGSMSLSKANSDLRLEKGPEFSIYPIAGGIYLNKAHTLQIYTALGLDYNTYHFEKDITLEKGQDELTYVIDPDKHFSKNLLRSTYLTMPLKLVIRPIKFSKFGISMGVEGGLLLGAKTKQINSESGKVKERGTFNLNPVRYGLSLGLGYDNFNIYAKYYLSDVFANGEGPKDFKTVALGVSFGLF